MKNRPVVIIVAVVIGIVLLVVMINRSGRTAVVTETTLTKALTQAGVSATIAAPPPMVIDQNKLYQAVLETSAGKIVIELNAKATPVTVNNFVFLAQRKFYSGTIFHRVIKGFMIQGGDPNGDGTGGPGYHFADEPFSGDYQRGTVAMANAGPDTNGSQFFIMQQDQELPKNYVIFGRVVQGMEVVDQIANAPVEAGAGGEMSKPVRPVTITAVRIITQ